METGRQFDRLPAKAEGVVPAPVWELSRHASGMSFDFETDAKAIHVRYTLLLKRLAMPTMAATGVSGLDLYGRHNDGWAWAGVTKPEKQTAEAVLVDHIEPLLRRWRLYLPLYNSIESLEVGVPDGASFTLVPPRAKPVVFYGTSIVHGASASRPGLAWPSIVGRRLDVPTINLGFSGNGKMEIELASLLGEIDAAAYVIDCAPNMTGDLIRERAERFVRLLRERRPEAPLVLVEDRPYGNNWIRSSARVKNEENVEAMEQAFASLADLENLHLVRSEDLLGEQHWEMLTDGSHPNDAGMMRYADALSPLLARVTGKVDRTPLAP
jgi:lysophospholipase L1-like esterase